MSVAWEYPTRSYVTAQPLLWNDLLYCSDWAGYIYCLHAKTGALIYEKRLYVPPEPNPLLRSIPVLSKFLGEPLPYLWYGLAGSGCISSGVWYLASVGGQKGGLFSNGKAGKLYAVKLETGAVLWSKTLSIQPYGGSLAVPTTDAKNVYAATCSIDETASTIYRILRKPFRASCAGEVFAFDKSSGQQVWRIKTTALEPNAPTGVNGAGVWGGLQMSPSGKDLLFATGNTYEKPVCCMNGDTGELLWCVNTKGTNAMTTGGITNGLYILGTYGGDLFALDTATGEQIWSLHLGKCSIGSNLTISDDAIYCGTGVPQLYGGYSKRHGVFKVGLAVR